MPDRPLHRSSESFSGWPRTLPRSVEQTGEEAQVLAEVAEAIQLERRTASRTLDVRVDSAERVGGEDGGLWRLKVALPPRKHLQSWDGALLFKSLGQGGQPWAAEVVSADLERQVLLVQGGFPEPEPGPAVARPADFLVAAAALSDNPRLAHARRDFSRLLLLSAGRHPGPSDVHGHALPAAAPASLRHGWSMVWGPPGTGKTHTLVEDVVRLLAHPETRVLVLATTNRATDEVALRLGARLPGDTVQRYGAANVREFVEKKLTRVLPASEPHVAALHRAEQALHNARTPVARARARVVLNRLRKGNPSMAQVLADDFPRCVVTTLYTGLLAVVRPEMDPFHEHGRAPFTTVIVDEAGLVPRATAAAVGLLAARQLILVGDPRQLSPICVAARSMATPVRRWLARSGMEHAHPDQPATRALVHQRRMHPAIAKAVSRFQYDGRLQNHTDLEQRPLPPSLDRIAGWPRAAWVVLDACEGLEDANVAAERGAGRSWVRPAGIDVLQRILEHTPALQRAEGLFISPYRAQARAAERLFQTLPAMKRWSASTVHAQQGTEAEVVVFDLVRHGGWPVPEWKRLVNVAMSRARHQLVFLAAENELKQPWLATLHDALTPCVVDRRGALTLAADPEAQVGLFGTTIDSVAASPAPRQRWRTGPDLPLPTHLPDDAGLGIQIRYSRAARRSMTRTQAQLVRRDLGDLGPRVVRGVAGSGKTIVLARWAALELTRHNRDATVVFGNVSLRPHLRDLLAQAWRVTVDSPTAEPPWDRIHLVHIRELLHDLRAEAALPVDPDRDPFDHDTLARRIAAAGLSPRFGLLYIDEAQDLGHDTLGLLISLVEPDPTGPPDHRPVRIFYDNAQNLYRRSTPRWSEFGLDVRGRSTVLRESFRSTRPAMELALDLLHQLSPLDRSPDFRELIRPPSGPPVLVHEDDGWRADFCVVQGQTPQVAIHPSREVERQALVARVQGWLAEGVPPKDIRVLAPTTRRCEDAEAALAAAGIPVAFQRSGTLVPNDPRIVVTTPHSFKGYEAELVVVLGLDGFCNRDGELLPEALYVALTRARTWMWVSATRVGDNVPSAAIVKALEAAVRLRPQRARPTNP